MRYRGNDEKVLTREFLVGTFLLRQLEMQPKDFLAVIIPWWSREVDVHLSSEATYRKFWARCREWNHQEPKSVLRYFDLGPLFRGDARVITISFRGTEIPEEDIDYWLRNHCEVLLPPQKKKDEFGIWNGEYKAIVMLRLKRDEAAEGRGGTGAVAAKVAERRRSSRRGAAGASGPTHWAAERPPPAQVRLHGQGKESDPVLGLTGGVLRMRGVHAHQDVVLHGQVHQVRAKGTRAEELPPREVVRPVRHQRTQVPPVPGLQLQHALPGGVREGEGERTGERGEKEAGDRATEAGGGGRGGGREVKKEWWVPKAGAVRESPQTQELSPCKLKMLCCAVGNARIVILLL